VKDVMKTLDIEMAAAQQQARRWLVHGFVERVKQGKYKKIIRQIVV
jgi:predicted transcriptional regulator of viral defense system